MYNISGSHLAKLAQYHLDVANHILDTHDLFAKLDHFDLATLGEKRSVIAKQIFDNPRLRDRLHGYSLAVLGENHLNIAKQLLDKPKLIAKLDGYDLARFGQHHFAIAKHIFETPTLFAKLVQGNHLGMLSQHLFVISQKVLGMDDLPYKLDGYAIFQMKRKCSLTQSIYEHIKELNCTTVKRNKLKC